MVWRNDKTRMLMVSADLPAAIPGTATHSPIVYAQQRGQDLDRVGDPFKPGVGGADVGSPQNRALLAQSAADVRVAEEVNRRANQTGEARELIGLAGRSGPPPGGAGMKKVEPVAMMIELRNPANFVDKTQWRAAVKVIEESPAQEKLELVPRMLELFAGLGEEKNFLVAATEYEVQMATTPSVLCSTQGTMAAVAQGVVRLASNELVFLEPSLSLLLKRAEAADSGAEELLFAALDDFLTQLGNTGSNYPPSIVLLCHLLFTESRKKFGPGGQTTTAAQFGAAGGAASQTNTLPNGLVGAFLISRVISPALLRLAQRNLVHGTVGVEPLPKPVTDVSRLIQKIARFCANVTAGKMNVSHVSAESERVFLERASEKLVRLAKAILTLPEPQQGGLQIAQRVVDEAPGRIMSILAKSSTVSPAAHAVLNNALASEDFTSPNTGGGAAPGGASGWGILP